MDKLYPEMEPQEENIYSMCGSDIHTWIIAISRNGATRKQYL